MPLFGSLEFFDRLILKDEALNSYDDFTPGWYNEVGSGLIMSMYIRIVLIILTFVFHFYYPRIKQWIDRGGINKSLVRTSGKRKSVIDILKKTEPNTKKKDHRSFLQVYKNNQFQIEKSYAEVLNTMFFSFTYWVMLPHIFVPATLVLITVYFKEKALGKFLHFLKF